MADPYAFTPRPVPPAAPPATQKPTEAPRETVLPNTTKAQDTSSLLVSLRQASITAVRSEVPVDQSAMRGW